MVGAHLMPLMTIFRWKVDGAAVVIGQVPGQAIGKQPFNGSRFGIYDHDLVNQPSALT